MACLHYMGKLHVSTFQEFLSISNLGWFKKDSGVIIIGIDQLAENDGALPGAFHTSILPRPCRHRTDCGICGHGFFSYVCLFWVMRGSAQQCRPNHFGQFDFNCVSVVVHLNHFGVVSSIFAPDLKFLECG
eukprot:6460699-Amphidinium_carterae.1